MPATNLWIPETLGSFSLDTLGITLAGPCPDPATLEEIPAPQRDTLEHEFGHFLHYTNTYVGLKHLSFVADLAEALRLGPLDGEAPEAHYSRRAERALLIFRLRQGLTIDDEYYFYGSRPDLAREASTRGHGAWCTSEGVGHLFHTDGNISDRAFWYAKFHLDEVSQERCFARVPGGMRVFLEHMARAIDLAVDCRGKAIEEVHEVWNRNVRLSYQPGNLHYYALTHLSGIMLERKYDRSAVVLAPVLAGLLVLHLCEIPFDDPDTWSRVQDAAGTLYPKLSDHLTHPHPSFLFPLIRRAFLEADLPAEAIADLNLTEIGTRIDEALGLADYGEATAALRDNLIRRFSNLDLGSVGELLRWSAGHYNALAPGDRLSHPLQGVSEALPVPVLFDDKGIEGTVLTITDCIIIADLHNTIAAQLRYPFVRNIIPL